MDFQWQCPVCQKVITHNKSVSRHKESHKETDYRYQKCSKEFTRPDNFKRHLVTCLIKKTEFKCKLCLKKFKERWMLKRSEKSHAGKAKILCKNCGKKFAASKIENRVLMCLTIKSIDETNLDDEFASMVPITRYDRF